MDLFAVIFAVVPNPFFEVGALRLASTVGPSALSATYVGFVWAFALLRPVRDAVATRGGWSTGASPRASEKSFESRR